MLTLLRKRLDKNEEDGFTLIELMVVVLIIAILIAIAIPTFLGAQKRAQDRGVQSELRNSVTAAKTIATDDAGELDTVTLALLTDAERNLTFVAGTANATTDAIGVAPAPPVADYIQFTKGSASGKFFSIALSKTGEVGFCSAATVAVPTAGVTAGALTGCVDAKW